MAVNDITYVHEVVNAGGSETNNDTLLKIAELKGVDADILLKLNPNINRKDEILTAGTKVLVSVGSITDTIDGFNTGTLDIITYDRDRNKYIVEIRDSKGNVITTTEVNPRDDMPGYLDLSLETIAKKAKSEKWYDKELTTTTLMKLNPWVETQMELIHMSKIIILEVCVPGTATMAKIEACGIRADSTRTCYIRWDWNHEVNNTSGMEVRWRWRSTDGEWWIGSQTDVGDIETKEAIYSPEDSAIEVGVSIRPKEKSSSSTSTTTKYSWSTEQIIHYHDNWAIATPSTPNVEIKQNKMTITYESLPIIEKPILQYNSKTNSYEVIGYERNIEHVQFEIVQLNTDNTSKLIDNPTLGVGVGGYVQYSCNVESGYKYRVRARCLSRPFDGITYYSAWCNYTNPINSAPVTPKIEECKVLGENRVEFKWNKINSADSYLLQYLAINENDFRGYEDKVSVYFDSNEAAAEQVQVDADTATYENNNVVCTVFNVEIGKRYLARVRAINTDAQSAWSDIIMFTYGEKPDSPTTWSTSTKAFVGDTMNLYWIHNSKDNSVETKAEVEVRIDGVAIPFYREVIKPTDKDKRDETSYLNLFDPENPWYEKIQNGCKITWRVHTMGVKVDDGYGPYSIPREIDIYTKPENPKINLKNKIDGNEEYVYETLRSLPLYVDVNIGSTHNQKVIGYVISLIADESYTTVDEVGNEKSIMKDSSIFSRYYNAGENSSNSFTQEIGASDVSLENNQHYKVTCTISMSSGLIVELVSNSFQVQWIAQSYQPNAEIGINKDTLTAHIRPFCDGGDSVNLFVYRREFDGTFTEIVANVADPEMGIENTSATWVTDPHPALDYARYRIISRHKHTGAINYFDVPSVPVQEKVVVIQWDEKWQNFNAIDGDAMMDNTDKAYAGSILKLKYNIDVSNTHSPDVSLVRYTGRSRPVSYYGTQRGESATWNMEIPKSDTEILYALRRLAIYMGDVYVREPSGSGYWASINISFSQAHRNLTIPITINITPVEGGM